MLEVIREINHSAVFEIEIDVAHPARAGSHLRHRLCRNIHTKEMHFAFHPSFEVNRFHVRRASALPRPWPAGAKSWDGHVHALLPRTRSSCRRATSAVDCLI